VAAKHGWNRRVAQEEIPAAQTAAPSPAGQTPPGSQAPAPPAPAGAPTSPPTAQELKDEAFAAVRELMEAYPASPAAVSCMGALYQIFRDPEEAEKWWNKAIALDPKRAASYVVLAEAAAVRGDFERAAQLWRQAQALAPDRPGMYRGCAAALLRIGKSDEAIAALRKELALSPGDTQCFALLGKAYLQRKEYEKAVEQYQRAMEVEPVDSSVPFGLATALARLGEKDKADATMQKFRVLRDQEARESDQDLREGPADLSEAPAVLALTLTDVGQVYAQFSNLRKAEECWQRAAAVDPKNQGCRHSLVELYSATGRLREALAVCDQLRALTPESAALELRIGGLLVMLGDLDAAERALRRAVDLGPTMPAGYRSLVRLALTRGRSLPEARAWAAKLVDLEPSAANYLLLGRTCHRTGDLPAARAAVERALQLEPGNELAQRARRALEEEK
jgi:tetratricopeptide (TPR) repeat protein